MHTPKAIKRIRTRKTALQSCDYRSDAKYIFIQRSHRSGSEDIPNPTIREIPVSMPLQSSSVETRDCGEKIPGRNRLVAYFHALNHHNCEFLSRDNGKDRLLGLWHKRSASLGKTRLPVCKQPLLISPTITYNDFRCRLDACMAVGQPLTARQRPATRCYVYSPEPSIKPSSAPKPTYPTKPWSVRQSRLQISFSRLVVASHPRPQSSTIEPWPRDCDPEPKFC